MEKIISTRDFADIKRMAQIVNPKVSRKTTLLKQKAKIDAEIAELDEALAGRIYERGKGYCLATQPENWRFTQA